MTHQLKEAICETPDDKDLMLVYADYLEEEGNLLHSQAWRWFADSGYKPIEISNNDEYYPGIYLWPWSEKGESSWAAQDQVLYDTKLSKFLNREKNIGKYYYLKSAYYDTEYEAILDMINAYILAHS